VIRRRARGVALASDEAARVDLELFRQRGESACGKWFAGSGAVGIVRSAAAWLSGRYSVGKRLKRSHRAAAHWPRSLIVRRSLHCYHKTKQSRLQSLETRPGCCHQLAITDCKLPQLIPTFESCAAPYASRGVDFRHFAAARLPIMHPFRTRHPL